MRLQKYFSECGLLSRRAAEAEIIAGNVSVNGVRAELGLSITPGLDDIRWNGKPVLPPSGRTGHTYIMLNKPIGYLTTMKDDRGRKTVSDLLHNVNTRVYPVGRLDMYSEGMLLFTDDGELANRMMHPSHDLAKNYVVTIKGILSDSDVERFTKPMTLDGYQLRPVEASLITNDLILPDGVRASRVRITLHEGRNRQIRKMCEQLNFTVIRLQRVQIGELTLEGLPCGHWRHLTESEIQYLLEKLSGDTSCL